MEAFILIGLLIVVITIRLTSIFEDYNNRR